jgi:hypothetical protein
MWEDHPLVKASRVQLFTGAHLTSVPTEGVGRSPVSAPIGRNGPAAGTPVHRTLTANHR